MKTTNRDWWRSASVTRWHVPTSALVIGVVVLTVMLVAAIVFEIASSGARSLPPQTGGLETQPLANGQFRFFPRSARITLGVPYRFNLYTHCGLDWPPAVDFDGSLWDPIGPGAVSDGSGSPPAGYGNPYDQGVMTLISPTLARYRSSGELVIQFSRHAGPRVSSACS